MWNLRLFWYCAIIIEKDGTDTIKVKDFINKPDNLIMI